MGDAERLEIGHDAGGVVEAELLAELQPIGGERDEPRRYRASIAAWTDHGGSRSGGAPPQTGSPGRQRLWPRLRFAAEVGQERQRFALVELPPRDQHRAVEFRRAWAGPKMRQARDDEAFPRRQEPLHQIEPPGMGRPVDRRPVERGAEHGLLRQWIGHVLAALLVRLGKLFSPPVADRVGKLALKIAEERKRPPRAPFVAHEHQRRRRREQRDGKRRLQRRRRREHRQPLAQRAVADLVVVLQEIDEGRGRQRRTRLAAVLAPPVRRRLALIGKPFGERPREMLRRVAIVAVIARGLAGQQHMEGVMIVVVPLRAVFAAPADR